MKIAVIPARGGSKRIPRKNIKLFHGLPIIAYSIKAALKSKCFDKVIVSTDDKEIANVAKSYGAEIPFFRSANLSDDHTGTNAVVADTIRRLGFRINYACCIYATAPFISAETIKAGLSTLQSQPTCEYAVTLTSFPFPIQRAVELDKEGNLKMAFPEHRMTRSQDLQEMYHDAGQIYWGKAEAFLQNRPLFSKTTRPVIIPHHLVQDIDTPEDWIKAESMFEFLKCFRFNN